MVHRHDISDEIWNKINVNLPGSMEHTGRKVTTFKERLSDLCAESPLNDTEIARELHVSKQTLSAWKCGTRSPKELTIISELR